MNNSFIDFIYFTSSVGRLFLMYLLSARRFHACSNVKGDDNVEKVHHENLS